MACVYNCIFDVSFESPLLLLDHASIAVATEATITAITTTTTIVTTKAATPSSSSSTKSAVITTAKQQ